MNAWPMIETCRRLQVGAPPLIVEEECLGWTDIRVDSINPDSIPGSVVAIRRRNSILSLISDWKCIPVPDIKSDVEEAIYWRTRRDEAQR